MLKIAGVCGKVLLLRNECAGDYESPAIIS